MIINSSDKVIFWMVIGDPFGFSGLDISWCQEPRAPLNSPAAPYNFCREPKDVVLSFWICIGSLEKILISSPAFPFCFLDAVCGIQPSTATGWTPKTFDISVLSPVFCSGKFGVPEDCANDIICTCLILSKGEGGPGSNNVKWLAFPSDSSWYW